MKNIITITITDPKAIARIEAMVERKKNIKRDLQNRVPIEEIEKKYDVKFLRGLPY